VRPPSENGKGTLDQVVEVTAGYVVILKTRRGLLKFRRHTA
jgi:hypothetical protein